jgi:primary-amine oxidase
VSASGYLQGGFWEPKQEGYGTAIRETTMGSLHDHVINFKVDLDVGGLDNSLLRTWTEVEEIEKDWFDEDWGKTVRQQKIHRKVIENENDARYVHGHGPRRREKENNGLKKCECRLKYPANFQGNYALVNTDSKNSWDAPRGYAIHPGYNPIHNVRPSPTSLTG